MSKEPTISTAMQRGNHVYVYGEDGSTITTLPGELVSFTGSSVSIRRGNHIYVYDPRGRSARTYPVSR